MAQADSVHTISRRFLLGAAAAVPLAAVPVAAASTAALPTGSILAMAQRVNAIQRRWNALDLPHHCTPAEEAEQAQLEAERDDLEERILRTPAVTLADCAAQAVIALGIADVATNSDHLYAISTGRLDRQLESFRFVFASILRQVSGGAGVPVGSIGWPDMDGFCEHVIEETAA